MLDEREPTVDADLIGERRHLLSLAFRMLGTVAEAEDAVQETYIRWYRMDQSDRDQIEVPRAWLTRVASRICLDTARARVRKAPTRTVPRDEHDRVVRAFAAASRSGDLRSLISVLDPGVVLRSDGGGRVSAARNPVHGADRVARFLLGALRNRPGVEILEQDTGDGLGFAMWEEGRIVGVVTLDVLAGLIVNVRMVLNPEKLSLWN